MEISYADAVNVYHRSREILEAVLGVAPSEQTEQIYKKIVAPPWRGLKLEIGK